MQIMYLESLKKEITIKSKTYGDVRKYNDILYKDVTADLKNWIATSNIPVLNLNRRNDYLLMLLSWLNEDELNLLSEKEIDLINNEISKQNP